jgi:hypothetical protein
MTKRLWVGPRNDEGASLVLALVFVTVVSLVVMAVLSFTEASMRTTIALRSEATEMAAAEGGAKVAIDALRDGTYVGSGPNCFGTADGYFPLNGFYATSGGAHSVRVECAPDTSATVLPNLAVPDYALLGLAEVLPGIDITRVSGSLAQVKRVNVQGRVHSNSQIRTRGSGLLTNRFTLTSANPGAGISASWPALLLGCPLIPAEMNPRCSANQAEVDPPDYAVPTEPPHAPTVLAPATWPGSGCPTNRYFQFQSGSRFTDADRARLETLTGVNSSGNPLCPNVVVRFMPGVHYFDWNGIWTIRAGTVVGGNPTVPLGAPNPAPPVGSTWCTTPFSTTDPNLGVEIVLSKDARIVFGSGARAEFCGRYSSDKPPIVFHGLKDRLTLGSLILQAINCVLTIDDSDGDLIDCRKTLEFTDGVAKVSIQGTIYVPNGKVEFDLDDSSPTTVQAGVIARKIKFNTNRTASTPVVSVPTSSSVVARTVVVLNVFVCPNQSTCPGDNPATPAVNEAQGRHLLRTKVVINNPTGAPPDKVITVASWSPPKP